MEQILLMAKLPEVQVAPPVVKAEPLSLQHTLLQMAECLLTLTLTMLTLQS
jgi:hypothetical protein